jgi:hypothetical protein
MLKKAVRRRFASLTTPMKRKVEYISRSDEFRTFSRATGQKIPELLHAQQTKRTAFLSVMRGYSPVVPQAQTLEILACQSSLSTAC